jgi:hypothetical protein
MRCGRQGSEAMTDIDKLEALRAEATQGPFEYSRASPWV